MRKNYTESSLEDSEGVVGISTYRLSLEGLESVTDGDKRVYDIRKSSEDSLWRDNWKDNWSNNWNNSWTRTWNRS